jgi:hypothetical protein
MAICDAGGGALGHPIEYIKVGYHGGKPVSFIVQKKGGHDSSFYLLRWVWE